MDKLIQILDKKPWVVFFIFSAITLLLYANTAYAGFVTDFLGWQNRYDNGGFADIINCFGYHGLHQVLHLVFYSMYRFLGTDTIYWYIIFNLLHAGAGFSMYWVFTKIFNDFALKQSQLVALFAAVLFLVSPYQGDVVVWRVCVHYLMMAYFFIFSVWHVHQWLQTRKNKHLVYLNLILIVALFSLELALGIPFLLLFYVLIWSLHFNDLKRIVKNYLNVLIPQLVIIAGWFTLNKIFIGALVGHYGAEDHLRFDGIMVFGNMFQYITKHLLFQRYWPHNAKMGFGEYFSNPYILIGIVVVCVVLFVLALVYFKKLSIRFRLAGLMLLLFFAALLPIVNLYLYMLQYVENDRYGYVASIFLSLFTSLLIMGLPKFFRWVMVIGLLVVSVYFTVLTNNYWNIAYTVHTKLLKQFQFYDYENIILLNIPENVEGAPILWTVKDEFDSTIQKALELKNYQPYTGNMMEVANYNLTSETDGVHVDVISSTHLKVDCNQWGTWFWRRGLGATNYENEFYKVIFSVKHYDLYLKQPLPNTKFIFWNGNDWEMVNRNI